MRILVAPGSFKGSLNSPEVAKNIRIGLHKASKEFTVKELPLADGGSGTVAVLTAAYQGECVTCRVCGPLGRTVTAVYGWVPRWRIAIIELAQAAGLALVPPKQRNPCITTTRGVGELIAEAVCRGSRRIVLGVGDSATIDCGMGALSVLGIRFLDGERKEVEHNCRGLINLRRIDDTQCRRDIRRVRITIAADVRNRLTGKRGAVVYARQKGATPATAAYIGRALRNFKRVVRDQYMIDVDTIPGAGAAGGVPAALHTILRADVQPGFRVVADAVNLQQHIGGSDVIMTGEGRIDKESFSGKVVGSVLAIARAHKKPVILVAGSIAREVLKFKKHGVTKYYSVAKSGVSLTEIIRDTPGLLQETAHTIGKDLLKKQTKPICYA
jgi:glycerate kinase